METILKLDMRCDFFVDFCFIRCEKYVVENKVFELKLAFPIYSSLSVLEKKDPLSNAAMLFFLNSMEFETIYNKCLNSSSFWGHHEDIGRPCRFKIQNA